MPPAHRRQLRPTGAERPGLTKQKQDRRHLAAAGASQPVSVSSLQAGVGRHRQAERLRQSKGLLWMQRTRNDFQKSLCMHMYVHVHVHVVPSFSPSFSLNLMGPSFSRLYWYVSPQVRVHARAVRRVERTV